MSADQGALAESTIFGHLSERERALLWSHVEELRYRPGQELIRQGETSDALFVIVNGNARVQRGNMALALMGPGDCFGEMGLLTAQPRAASVRAASDLVVARLGQEALEELANSHPHLAMKFFRNVALRLRHLLTDMTDTVSLLLQERSRRQRTEVAVTIDGESRLVKTGTPVEQLLPEHIDDEPVVAALLDRKAVSLSTPLFAPASLQPVTRSDWEGRDIYRHTVRLVLLEAAHHLEPPLSARMGPSLGFAQLVEAGPSGRFEAEGLERLTAQMKELVAADVPIRRERWTVEEARAQFVEQGWGEAAGLLRTWRDTTVPLVSCGELYAFELLPLLPSTRHCDRFDLVGHDGEVLLYFGDSKLRADPLVRAVHPGALAREHEQWLKTLGLESVGAFNEICIRGDVSQIIHVSEGFHEKRISQIADQIAHAERPVRAICISGPSSAGKTTFIKRLSVQLQVNGLTPWGLSLDNYYVNREATVRDEHGEYDFEAFEALEIPLLADHLTRLMRGQRVRTARYDFPTGRSHPEGGPEIELAPRHVLMLEGIHALNPRLPLPEGEHGTFRIFVNPMTSLPLDHLTRVSVSDIRLLRRIVRDRHQRAISAADNIVRWPKVQRGERRHIFPYQDRADAVFNTSLIYEPSVLKVYAERYLLEVPSAHVAYTTAYRLRRLIDHFVAIYPDHVPPTSLLREFIGGGSFEH